MTVAYKYTLKKSVFTFECAQKNIFIYRKG